MEILDLKNEVTGKMKQLLREVLVFTRCFYSNLRDLLSSIRE